MSRRGDSGETLLELIIAVVILGIAGVAIVGGFATVILVSDYHRKEATAGTAAHDYAEAIETAVASGGYKSSCTPGYAYTPPAGFTAQISAVRFWTGSAFQSTCDASADQGLQQVTVQVSSTDKRATEQLVIVVRKPCGTGDPSC